MVVISSKKTPRIRIVELVFMLNIDSGFIISISMFRLLILMTDIFLIIFILMIVH
jgi:hypothetical protein